LSRIIAHTSRASFFGPQGGAVQGAEEVAERYERDCAGFASGESRFEILHMAAGDGVAYWTGFQHASAKFKGSDQGVTMKLRVTEVFRREGSEWKLVHRHADMLAQVQEAKKPG
jgi:ketosteroid isomerase-like protein